MSPSTFAGEFCPEFAGGSVFVDAGSAVVDLLGNLLLSDIDLTDVEHLSIARDKSGHFNWYIGKKKAGDE